MSANDPIRRLREIAAEAANHAVLADGPVTADAALLDLCAEALHLLATGKKLREEADRLTTGSAGTFDERIQLGRESWRFVAEARKCMYRAAKMRAQTPAGIYAKALLVKGSITGASVLAKTLAEDLIGCRELRESLWPASAE